jgi:hypothetical protein
MDADILMGVIFGFFLGIGFTILFTNIISWRVAAILEAAITKKIKKKKKKDIDEDDTDYWKPPGWRPDE